MTGFHPFNIDRTLFAIAVPKFESNELYLIQPTDTDRKVTKVKVGNGPSAVANSGDFIYVANTGSNDISVIDSKTNQVVNTIKVGTAPSSIAYYPEIHNIYVANSGSNDVSVIHEDHAVLGGEGPVVRWPVFVTEKVGTAPSSIAYNPNNNNLIYVANSGSNNVSIIHEYRVHTTVKVGTTPSGISCSPKSISDNVYVANSGSNERPS
jgi:YVTN family beta-propeller protein